MEELFYMGEFAHSDFCTCPVYKTSGGEIFYRADVAFDLDVPVPREMIREDMKVVPERYFDSLDPSPLFISLADLKKLLEPVVGHSSRIRACKAWLQDFVFGYSERVRDESTSCIPDLEPRVKAAVVH